MDYFKCIGQYVFLKIPFNLFLPNSNIIEYITLNFLLVLSIACNCILMWPLYQLKNVQNDLSKERKELWIIIGIISFMSSLLFLITSNNNICNGLVLNIILIILLIAIFIAVEWGIICYSPKLKQKILKEIEEFESLEKYKQFFLGLLVTLLFPTILAAITIICNYGATFLKFNIPSDFNTIASENKIILSGNNEYIITAPYRCDQNRKCIIQRVYQKEKIDNKKIKTQHFESISFH